jgi:hypothetical protein
MDNEATGGHGYCGCECGARTSIATRNERSRGVKKGEPRRYVRGHHRRKKDRWVPVQLDHPTPCWIWRLARNRDGYGVAWSRHGKMTLAHRVEYEKHIGPVPEGLTLDHLCRERGCVNPEHVEPVTQAENNRRGRGTKLTPGQVREIRESSDTQIVLARRHRISQPQVSRIKRGRSWFSLE